ncbi:MAG: hypothetical protein K5765_04260 [Clostridia bacterium]|nr:hypothetical protein [Clostridia bacterium]
MNYQQNENELLNCYLDKVIFRKEYDFDFILRHEDIYQEQRHNSQNRIESIELIVRPECNQKCEYCYIARYGADLYPFAERLSNEEILHNIDLVLDYVFNTRNLYIDRWEVFAGDLFYDGIFFDMCDLFIKYLTPKQQLYPNIFDKFPGLILTPTNFSFIRDPEKKQKLEEYIEYFQKNFNWEIGFSVSTDGKYAIDTREQIDLDDSFFDDCFKWTIKYHKMGFHPIISASNVHNAIKNYDWWRDMCHKWYTGVPEKRQDIFPYWLEARNDEWTQDNIDDFLKLLNHMVDDRLRMCNNNVKELAYHFTVGDGQNNTLLGLLHGDLIWFNTLSKEALQDLGCSMSISTIINISNLSLPPCHRLTYPQFNGGFFKVQDDKIVDIEAFNLSLYLTAKTANAKYLPKCSLCEYSSICHKGCFGAQCESTGEIFQPAISVCNLEKQRFDFLIYKYYNLDLFKAIEEQEEDSDTIMLLRVVKNIFDNIEDVEREKYDRIINEARID